MDSLYECLTLINTYSKGIYSSGTWYAGNISSGQAKELTMITSCDKTGEFNNVAVIRGDQHDFNLSNNKA